MHHQVEMQRSIQEARKFSVSFPRFLHQPRQVEGMLEKYSILKAMENEKLDWVTLDPELYQTMVDYIAILEDQLEQTNLNLVIETRKRDTEFKTGLELETDALELLKRNPKVIQEHLHGNNE